MSHTGMNAAGGFLMGQSSGTAFQPAAWPMPMLMHRTGGWNLLWMGQASVVAAQQSGPRGGDKVYSANWGMLGAIHRLGRGSVMLRTMVSLDPLTVTSRRYPLLFQTGEGAYGKPIVEGQHPHDLLMELSVQYARPVGERGMLNVYYAPVGDAALGPVAFPHRASAMELPQATLAHHWQDATHIANNLITAGFSWDKVRLEASGFRGKEFDSTRTSVLPGSSKLLTLREVIHCGSCCFASVLLGIGSNSGRHPARIGRGPEGRHSESAVSYAIRPLPSDQIGS